MTQPDGTTTNFSDFAVDGVLELPDRYIEVTCPCGCGHSFEIDLTQWVNT